MFVDPDLIEFLPNAYISLSSMLEDSNQTLSDFVTTDLYLKTLIEQPLPELVKLY